MTNKTRFLACLLATLICVASTASGLKPASNKPATWEALWTSVKVDPPPPGNFLDVSFDGRIDNFTNGQISDTVARKWVFADLRRGTADTYAAMNLREDIANANIFGPPGLNGTGPAIRAMRANGVERIEGPDKPDIIAAAVIAVPQPMTAEQREAGLTNYVIVLLYRSTRGKTTMIYRDGRHEASEGGRDGELHWQLDTGHFFEHPTLGPLWYQKNGWSCRPDDTAVGQLCGRVKP
jgi:hypothetical protein